MIDSIVQYAQTKIKSSKQRALFSEFAQLFYSHASLNDLKNRPVSELFSMAYSHWELAASEGRANATRVRVFNPDYSKYTVVEVMMKDMPFIVDSLRMEMNRLDLTIHLMIYMGGMRVTRDKEGVITAVAPYDENDQKPRIAIESPVYIEVDRQADSKTLQLIEKNIKQVLKDVQAVVVDWPAMQARVTEAITELSKPNPALAAVDVKESVSFLQWLADGQFTFLGARDYKVVGSGDELALSLVPNSGLGVLRDEAQSKKVRSFLEIPKAAREFMLTPKHLLVISKTNTLSTVHRLTYTDYIGIKQFDQKGKLIGERRIIGLFTSAAYSSRPDQIPFLRDKVISVLKKSGFPPKSHAGKDLMHILETFPRDDLFQATVDELHRITMGVIELQDRQKLSLFVREDAHGRYVSCLVYVPRDNFNSELIKRIETVLIDAFHGTESTYTTYFYTPVLTRIHYVIRLSSKDKLKYDVAALENKLAQVAKSWTDGFKEAVFAQFGDEKGIAIFNRYKDSFSAGYREAFTPMQAAFDLKHIEGLNEHTTLGMSLYRLARSSQQEVKFKLFRFDETMPLSDTLPILENLSLRVIEEQAYLMTFKEGRQLWINDFVMRVSKEVVFDIEKVGGLFQDAFEHIWMGDAESDSLNGLVLEAELNWREIAVLRAYRNYLRQAGFTLTPEYISDVFVKYPKIAKSFIQLFHLRFNPKLQKEKSEKEIAQLEEQIQKQIDDVALLDEDRIFRRFLALIKATLRTNFYQVEKTGKCKTPISFKFSPDQIPELPLPLPMFEIFVYSPQFEGVHLRGSKVARGGLRWSDRREDFRTEVLGLMKAQQVKNAVIVPAGAKGGFFPKNLPINGGREAILNEAIACYKGFIQSLLDITDNCVGDKIVRPKNTVCYDDADPYLVVAADKGTATFSDIANQIAIDNEFWLGDAFASGGSAGYDHKKMGITARGAWVSAERHFQNLDINVNETEITAVGIGDLSGDVFGNGVLLSQHLKLVAAFNHMHIFLDPNPDCRKSFEERKRIFNLPRSTWADYRAALISQGGGIYPRSAKFIVLTEQVKKLLDVADDRLSPNELIQAILKAPVDMIWNGGIGTYVKATEERNEAVGDRSNDAVRVNGAELRSRVVVEGGNLGLTQLGRIEYALLGGLINTDFIDNSAGVDCSDHEVNIKILLNAIIEKKELSEKQRNPLLASMTDEVGDLVLHDNYYQNQAVSFLSTQSPGHMNLYIRYLEAQEAAGKINRALEFLPDKQTLLERRTNSQGLTRPEIAVLFAYSKIILKEQILQSELLQDAALTHYIDYAFPTLLRKKYSRFINEHRLRNEILATQIANQLVSRMGITFVYQMMDETGSSIAAIVRAFLVAYEIFHVEEIWSSIVSLDYRINVELQNQMMDEAVRLVRRATRWLLRHSREQIDITTMIAHFESQIKALCKRLPKLLSGSEKEDVDARREKLIAGQVPEDIATRLASVRSQYNALNIIDAATVCKADVYQVAQIYFALVDHLELHWFRDRINDHPITHRWSVLAKAAFKADLDWVQRELTISAMNLDTQAKGVTPRVNAWLEKHHELITRWRLILADLHNETLNDFSIVSVGIRELFDLVQAAK